MLASDVVERAERRVGTTLCGKWHLDGVLGVGGMATVYAATHRNRNRVAIKMLHSELSVDEGVRSRFLREGYAANTIEHSGAVKVLDDEVTEDGSAFLVMELLDGESVEERAVRKGGVLSLSEALEIARQLLEVLEAAHDHGIVHRDIKPDNLFVAQGGQLKVLDFGIARMRQAGTGSTRVGSFMGTPAFSAPEQARGRWNEVDARSDIFAVGATLFSALTGRPVHEAETPSEQLALAISTPAPRLLSVAPHLPEDVARMVDRALAYDKAERFSTAREMLDAVRPLIDQHPLEAPLSSPSRRLALPSVDRSAETLIASALASAPRRNPRTPSFGGLTTTPATPQALASVRRIAAGVLLAGGTGLAVGLGAWWLAQKNAVPPPPAGAVVRATAGQAEVAQKVLPSPTGAESAAPQASASAGEAGPVDAPQVASTEPVAKQAVAEKNGSATKSVAAPSAAVRHKPAPAARPATPAGSPASAGSDDLYDIRY